MSKSVVRLASLAIEKALEDGVVTAASKTALHHALHALRVDGGDTKLLEESEALSATMRVMVHCRREGQVNLYASKLLRVRSIWSRCAQTAEAAHA